MDFYDFQKICEEIKKNNDSKKKSETILKILTNNLNYDYILIKFLLIKENKQIYHIKKKQFLNLLLKICQNYKSEENNNNEIIIKFPNNNNEVEFSDYLYDLFEKIILKILPEGKKENIIFTRHR